MKQGDIVLYKGTIYPSINGKEVTLIDLGIVGCFVKCVKHGLPYGVLRTNLHEIT
jgi:hypothetical protein